MSTKKFSGDVNTLDLAAPTADFDCLKVSSAFIEEALRPSISRFFAHCFGFYFPSSINSEVEISSRALGA